MQVVTASKGWKHSEGGRVSAIRSLGLFDFKTFWVFNFVSMYVSGSVCMNAAAQRLPGPPSRS